MRLGESAIGALACGIEFTSTLGTFRFAGAIQRTLTFAAVHPWCFRTPLLDPLDNQRVGDHVVKCLLLLSKHGHDKTNAKKHTY